MYCRYVLYAYIQAWALEHCEQTVYAQLNPWLRWPDPRLPWPRLSQTIKEEQFDNDGEKRQVLSDDGPMEPEDNWEHVLDSSENNEDEVSTSRRVATQQDKE